MNNYLHQNDAVIWRNDSNYPDYPVTLTDEEGEPVYGFPKNWTDEMVYLALAFANESYSVGVKVGKARKEREIKKVLGVK